MIDEDQILNGQVWESPSSLRAVAQWIDGDRWVLLSTPMPAADGGTCSIVHTNNDGNVCYTAHELHRRLRLNGWRLTRITLGELEP